jgi:protein arginine kinase
MHSYLNHLAKVFGPITRMAGDGVPVVLYSKVRLIRNLHEFPFPAAASKEALQAANGAITDVVAQDLRGFSTLSIDDLDASDKRFCVERRWATKRWERQEVGSISIAPACGMTLTTNEEDHIGIRTLLSGLNLIQAYERGNTVDDALSRRLIYAFDGQLGYLTTRPIRSGLGLSACVCVHVPALVWGEKIAPIALAARAIGCNIIGFNGRESSAEEDLFFISNRPAGEGDEITVLRRLNSFVETIAESEKAARKAFLERMEPRLRDRFHRVLAVLQNARIVEMREAQILLMQMRLATDLQWLPSEFRPRIDALLIRLRSSHLKAEHAISDGQEDSTRAEILHETFANVRFAA